MSTSRPGPTPDGPQAVGPITDQEQLVESLVRASFVIMAALNRVAGQHDLSLTQMRVLGILRDRRPQMAELADHLGLERSTMSGLIDRAVQRGLVRREPSPTDGRAFEVTLTEQGRELAATLEKEVAEQAQPWTSQLSPADQRRLTVLLRRMR